MKNILQQTLSLLSVLTLLFLVRSENIEVYTAALIGAGLGFNVKKYFQQFQNNRLIQWILLACLGTLLAVDLTLATGDFGFERMIIVLVSILFPIVLTFTSKLSKPRFNRIDVIIEVGIVLCIIGLAFTLRFINLDILYPYTDEYIHLRAAKEVVKNGVLEYQRAPLVTYLVAASYQIGNPDTFLEYMYWGRLPGVIFSTLTVIPIYLLARKINRYVGYIAGFFWATSPWVIGVGRAVREYAFYPFFIIFAVLIAWDLLEKIFENRIKKTDWIYMGLLAAFLLYAAVIDYLSTLKIILILILSIAAFAAVVYRSKIQSIFDQQKKQTKRVLISLAVFFLFIGGVYILQSPHLNLSEFEPTWVWGRYFLSQENNSIMHWWDETKTQYIIFFTLIPGIILGVTRKEKNYWLITWLFFTGLAFYIFLFDRYARPRYIFHLMPFFTIWISYGVYAWTQIFPQKWRPFAAIGIVCISLGAISFQNITYAISSRDHQYIRTTNEYHDNVSGALDFVKENKLPGDVFITTIMGDALYIAFDISQARIYQYNHREYNRFSKVEEIVNKKESGWIILDSRRNGGWSEGYPREGVFMIGNKQIKILQNLDGIQVYRWNKDKIYETYQQIP